MPARTVDSSPASAPSSGARSSTDGDPAINVALAVGRLSRPPAAVTLPSGTVMVRFELTVRTPGEPAESMPVVWFDPPARATTLAEGATVVVVGRVRRRFYRGGGALRSSTEVVASSVAPVTRRAARLKASNALRAALAELGA